MPVFENLSQLMQFVGNVTLDEIASDIEKQNEDILLRETRKGVYANPSSSEYDNTFSLLNAVSTVTIVEGGGADKSYTIETSIDPNQMTYDYPSFYTGSDDNRENIVGWLNDGHGGYYMNRPINYQGRHFIDKSRKQINKDTKKYIMKRLASKGYKLGKTFISG